MITGSQYSSLAHKAFFCESQLCSSHPQTISLDYPFCRFYQLFSQPLLSHQNKELNSLIFLARFAGSKYQIGTHCDNSHVNKEKFAYSKFIHADNSWHEAATFAQGLNSQTTLSLVQAAMEMLPATPGLTHSSKDCKSRCSCYEINLGSLFKAKFLLIQRFVHIGNKDQIQKLTNVLLKSEQHT